MLANPALVLFETVMSTEQLIPLAVIPVVLILVLLRNRKKRILRPERMWIMPALVVPLIGLGIWGEHMRPGVAAFDPLLAVPAFALALVLGGLLGWQRGRTITIEREPDGTLMAQASPLGLILLVGLIAARTALRQLMQDNAAAWHLNAAVITDAFMVFAIGLIVMQRVEMVIRARRVQAGALDTHTAVVG